MADSVQSGKRIAKNALFLYIRMIFILGVSLYTSRVVLDKLGGTIMVYTMPWPGWPGWSRCLRSSTAR